jgi:ribosome-binding protein aMBF1 (putative translation factor)
VNRGAVLLNKLVPEGNQTRVAEELDIDQSYLNRVARADRVPGLEVRRKLRDHFGIALDAWDEEEPPPDTERAS